LLAEAARAEEGKLSKAPKGSLRWIARQLLERAGKETAAAREIANRLDGPPEPPPEVDVSSDNPVTSVQVTFVVPQREAKQHRPDADLQMVGRAR
jgi:hypothetical protein